MHRSKSQLADAEGWGGLVVRIGIVGCNYGRMVHLPAFRTDPRCEIVALAGTDAVRTAQLARESGVAHGFGNWEALVEHRDVDAVVIATPPQAQPQIALRALALGKPVFVEKPIAADLAGAADLVRSAASSRCPAMVDFQFAEIAAWRRAKELLDGGAIGRLRHVMVTWNVENVATRLRLKSWKTSREAGGGTLGNFVSHCFYYLEWFCGPFSGLSARLFGLPDAGPDNESTAVLAFALASNAGGSLAVSSASYLGSGHRIEFYGEDGTLTLANRTTDTMRGFELMHARRPAAALAAIDVQDPLDSGFPDGRIAPVARLAARFLDAIEQGTPAWPGLAEGYRVQQLIDAARRSHDLGRWIDTAPEALT